MSTLTSFIQHSFGSQNHNNQIKKIKRILFGKEEVKLKLFSDNMILYIDATRKLLELINEFGKVAGYKINTQKSVAFLYTNQQRSERKIQ